MNIMHLTDKQREELDAILASEEGVPIEILPNGEVRAKGQTSPGDVVVKPLTLREDLGGEYGGNNPGSDMPKAGPCDCPCCKRHLAYLSGMEFRHGKVVLQLQELQKLLASQTIATMDQMRDVDALTAKNKKLEDRLFECQGFFCKQ